MDISNEPGPNVGGLNQDDLLKAALAGPAIPAPRTRRLRIYASDPTLGADLATYDRAETIIEVPWEKLQPGPIGEYVEVVDIDPASNAAYAPVDLDHPFLTHDAGLPATETDPRFHQQMAYAVASRAIEVFERALGRRALWAPRFIKDESGRTLRSEFVQRLRIYPHGVRAANAYYSPDKKALLLGYFNGREAGDAEGTVRPIVFAALSHDVIAHETAHALLDGLHRRYVEATNPDCLAFHEAFADMIALFLHFTLPDAVAAEIAATRGDLLTRNRLGEIASQFGRSTGGRGALRDYIGFYDDAGTWQRRRADVNDYSNATEPHPRGAVLVAAVFDAYLQVYEMRARKVFRLATGGSGIAPAGDLPPVLVKALGDLACTVAGQFLNILIRALDYCPPFDIDFGEYLRAVITADRDLVPEDPHGYRVALAAAFRARGIVPYGVRSVSPDALAWEGPDFPERAPRFEQVLRNMKLDALKDESRAEIDKRSRSNAAIFHKWLTSDAVSDENLEVFGIRRAAGALSLALPDNADDGSAAEIAGTLRGPEVHSVRTLRRVSPDGSIRSSVIIEVTQSWYPDSGDDRKPFRGGSTIILDRETGKLDYVIRKRITSAHRLAAQRAFRLAPPTGLRAVYFDSDAPSVGEPFAMLHALADE
ncbi:MULTISPECIES: hypothetical protein [Sphingomonas]|uniref:hypothetical protein n=1 Tax=Sphingomonas TaxID=13687 RepID=UPI000833CBD9|nr:hypothetical protein [Sphingomonas sp. CCH10-B3]